MPPESVQGAHGALGLGGEVSLQAPLPSSHGMGLVEPIVTERTNAQLQKHAIHEHDLTSVKFGSDGGCSCDLSLGVGGKQTSVSSGLGLGLGSRLDLGFSRKPCEFVVQIAGHARLDAQVAGGRTAPGLFDC